jgi:hypothetical protein
MKVEIKLTAEEKDALQFANTLIKAAMTPPETMPDKRKRDSVDYKNQKRLELAHELIWQLISSYATFDWEVE